jgi:hypothetical protein
MSFTENPTHLQQLSWSMGMWDDKDIKYFYYISMNKIDVLSPQMLKWRFSLPKITPKVGAFGVSVEAQVETKGDPNLVRRTTKLLHRMHKSNSVLQVNVDHDAPTSKFFFANNVWRHGLFYFKGGTPSIWYGRTAQTESKEDILVVSVIYFAWTMIEDTLIILVGSPSNILGIKIAPEGIFIPIPGTGGVHQVVQDLVNSLRTDEPHAISRELSLLDSVSARSLGGVELGLSNLYVEEYGNEPLPLPGLGGYDSYPLYLATFCFKYLSNLPETRLESVFRVLSVYKSGATNFLQDLQSFISKEIEKTVKLEKQHGSDFSTIKKKHFRELIASEIPKRLFNCSKIWFGSPIYTALR